MKVKEKNDAVKLRKTGLTYREILDRLPVSKGSLSYWLRTIKLTDSQKQRIYNKNLCICKRFIEYNNLKHQEAISKKENIFAAARKEISNLSSKELKMVGIALYWAEGYKANSAKYVEFTNSDPAMIRLMMKWFREICNVADSKLRIRIQLHNKNSLQEAIKFWVRHTGIPSSQFTRPYVRISPTSQKKSKNLLPYGICYVRISDITLLEKIKGWIKGLGGPIV